MGSDFTKLDICAVVVTYGERISLLEKVISRLVSEGVSSLVIVSNGQSPEVRESIRSLCDYDFINLIFNDENLGSAGGYNQGLNYFLDQRNEEFVILLDDDNLISEKGLNGIVGLYRENRDDDAKKIYCANRLDRIVQQKSLSRGLNINYLDDSFLGYNIISLFKNNFSDSEEYIHCDILPYGGMVIKRNILLDIGLPDEKLFLYSDDYEFSLRAKSKGYDLCLLKNISVTDIDTSWHVDKKGAIILDPEASHMRVYYTIRNGIVTDLRYTKKSNFYYFNLIYFILIQIIKDLKSFKFNFIFYSNWKLFLKAYSDANNNQLGKVDIK